MVVTKGGQCSKKCTHYFGDTILVEGSLSSTMEFQHTERSPNLICVEYSVSVVLESEKFFGSKGFQGVHYSKCTKYFEKDFSVRG